MLRFAAPRKANLGFALLACALLGSAAFASDATPPSDGPDPREIPLPRIRTATTALPGVGDLPPQRAIPDVLTRADGTKVTTAEQWSARRGEIRRILEHYAVGHLPSAPGNVKGRITRTETLLAGSVTYRLVHLTFGPNEKLSLDIGIFRPTGSGPFPAVITPSGTPPLATGLPRLPPGPGQGRGANALLVVGPGEGPGNSPDQALASAGANLTAPAPQVGSSVDREPDPETIAAQLRHVFARGYAYVMFNHNDCGEDTTLRMADGAWAFRSTRFPAAYPDYDWGLLGVWAWGTSRIIDYLERDPTIDRTKLIVAGVSRTGKAALIAGAFDERIALTAPAVTGGGGVGAYRFSGAGRGGKEGLGDMMRKYPNWFSPHLRQFWGHTDRLPFDQHWFIALMAPRAFLALEGLTDSVSLPQAVQQSVRHARPVYALLGVEDRLGVNYAEHGHVFTHEDWNALLDFADEHLRGKKSRRRFDRFPTDEEISAAAGKSSR